MFALCLEDWRIADTPGLPPTGSLPLARLRLGPPRWWSRYRGAAACRELDITDIFRRRKRRFCRVHGTGLRRKRSPQEMIGRARSGTGARASSLEMRPEFGLSVELLETKDP
jgi:hypothetical protein